MTNERLNKLHAICEQIRIDHWAGIDESKSFCHKCPEIEKTSHGEITRGCILLAIKCFEIATRQTLVLESGFHNFRAETPK